VALREGVAERLASPVHACVPSCGGGGKVTRCLIVCKRELHQLLGSSTVPQGRHCIRSCTHVVVISMFYSCSCSISFGA